MYHIRLTDLVRNDKNAKKSTRNKEEVYKRVNGETRRKFRLRENVQNARKI